MYKCERDTWLFGAVKFSGKDKCLKFADVILQVRKMGNYVFNRMEWDEMGNGNIKFKFARKVKRITKRGVGKTVVQNKFCFTLLNIV